MPVNPAEMNAPACRLISTQALPGTSSSRARISCRKPRDTGVWKAQPMPFSTTSR